MYRMILSFRTRGAGRAVLTTWPAKSRVWPGLPPLPLPGSVVRGRAESCGHTGQPARCKHLGKPLECLAPGQVALARHAPQPERRFLGRERVVVLGIVRVEAAWDVLAVVEADLFHEPDLGRCRVVLCLQPSEGAALLRVLSLFHDPPRIAGQGPCWTALAGVPAEAGQHIGHDLYL